MNLQDHPLCWFKDDDYHLKVKVNVAVSPTEPGLIEMGACLSFGQQKKQGGQEEKEGGEGGVEGGGDGGGARSGGGGGGRQAHRVASSPVHLTLKTDRETFEASPPQAHQKLCSIEIQSIIIKSN